MRNIPAPVLVWRSVSASWNAMADESGSNRLQGKELPSSSPFRDSTTPPVHRLNLLLAEDNLPDALLVREAILQEKLPLEVYVASDGEKAIDFIAKAEESPDEPCPHLLMLDLNLPKRDGFEVLRYVR